MSDSNAKNLNGLSAVERLKATDKYLTEMRGILASMDEIAALRRQRGEAPSDEFGGYKRSNVEGFVRQLEKQKESILAEIARTEAKTASQGNVPAPAAPQTPAPAAESSLAYSRDDNPVTSFRKGDPSLAIESMYTGLSMDIEKMRDDILQEMKYTYKQDMAIYDDLSAKIDAIKPADTAAIEETLKPIGENITAVNETVASVKEDLSAVGGSLSSIEEKVSALTPVNYEELAECVAQKMVGGIDYNALAQHIVGIMTGGMSGAAAASAIASNEERAINDLSKKLDSIQSSLEGAISVKEMPEFRRLDTLIAEYLRTYSFEMIPDLLLSANGIKDMANRYIISGNILRGETMLSDLRLRLTRVGLWGSAAIAIVSETISMHKLPVTYAPEALTAFAEVVKEYEQAPVLPDEELTNRLLAAKKTVFNDVDMDSMDRETFAEMLEIRQDLDGAAPEKGTFDNLSELKKELMSFNLSYFIDFSPAVRESASSETSVDTQAILDAIARMGTAPAAAAPAPAPRDEKAEAEMQARLADLHKSHAGVSVKKPRQLRPAISSKDNKVEKQEQPLRTVRRKIDTAQEEGSLSKQVVEEMAQIIAGKK